jgi:2Fe-2S ferredoxin
MQDNGMVHVTFVAFDGARQVITFEPRQSVMQAAVNNNVSGIDGDCGGSMACGSCLVYLDADWLARAGNPSDFEMAMLELSTNFRPNSRLACQINLSPTLDGLVVHTPELQKI